MPFQTSFIWAIGAILVAMSYFKFGWQGVALVGGGMVFWVLLHFSRMMTVLKRAAQRPIGHVASAVMLNAKLQRGKTLLHVTAMTKSLGQLQSPMGEQPEIYRWADEGGSHVICTFVGGKLTDYTLWRPPQEADPALTVASTSTPTTLSPTAPAQGGPSA